MASEYAIDLTAAYGMTNLFFIARFYLRDFHNLPLFCFLMKWLQQGRLFLRLHIPTISTIMVSCYRVYTAILVFRAQLRNIRRAKTCCRSNFLGAFSLSSEFKGMKPFLCSLLSSSVYLYIFITRYSIPFLFNFLKRFIGF